MEKLTFEQVYAGVLADFKIGANVEQHLMMIKTALDEVNHLIDNSKLKPSENTGMHIFKSRLLYLSNEALINIENGNKL